MLLKLIAVCVVVFGLIGTGSSQNNNARLAEVGREFLVCDNPFYLQCMA